MVLMQRPGHGLMSGRPLQAEQVDIRLTASRHSDEGETWHKTQILVINLGNDLFYKG